MTRMGSYSYGTIKMIGKGELVVGKYCSIASGVQAVMVGHNPKNVSTYPFNSKYFSKIWPEAVGIPGHPISKRVFIGNDVWIGQNSLLLGGAIISDGAVVGAGSVVRGYLEPYAIYIGNPAKMISMRFSPENIGWLLLIRWWDWPEEKINKYLPLLCGENINEFIERAKEELNTIYPKEGGEVK